MKKGFAHDYDPSIVFQSHSSDLPHLNDWISELIALSEKSLPIQSSPTTEQLVQALQRYDAMFRELLRQTSVFSEPVTRLLAKVWGGNLKLLDYMIKSYNRYVKHTTHLQEQAQHLLTERQGQMVAAKVKDEEFEMEKLVLRARIRNLEAEVEALKLCDRSKEKEIHRLRTTVTSYMKSDELSEQLWKLMHSYDPVALNKDGEIPSQIESKFCRKDAIDASIVQLKQLCRLDVEMDEVISGVMKEEDRQRMIVADMLRLMKKNEAVFGVLRKVKGKWQSGVIEPTKFEDKGVQSDERDVFGAVTDLVRSPRNMPRINPPPAPNEIIIFGGDVPYQLRKLMKSFPRVLRIPPAAWVCQTIMAIYFDKVRIDEGLKEKGLTTMPLAAHMHDFFKRSMGNEAAADTQIAQMLAACEYYKEKFPRVSLFCSQIGLFNKNEDPTLDVRDTDFLLSIVRMLLKNGEMLVVDHSRAPSQQGHADGKKHLALHGAGHATHRGGHKDALNHPVEHSAAMVTAASVAKANHAAAAANGKNQHTTYSIWNNLYSTVGSDISRATATKVVHQVLGRWLPDGGADYVMKIKAMTGTDKMGKMIDIDEFMEAMLEPWSMIRINWVEHARYLFKEHCLIHKVLSEAQFNDDGGQFERDSILVEVQRVVAVESQRRPMRAFQVRAAITDNNKSAAGGTSRGRSSQSNTKDKGITLEKEPVCETMNRKLFASVIAIMDNSIPLDKVDAMFDDACAWSHDACLHVLSYMWLRCTYEKQSETDRVDEVSDDEEVEDEFGTVRKVHRHHGRYYYVNTKTKKTQWIRPYHESTFYSSEIEVDAFIAIILKHDILANCPFVELFHVAPPDLWPNAVLFLKQAQDAKVKAKRIADSLLQQQQQAQQLQQAALAVVGATTGAGNSATNTRPGSKSSKSNSRRASNVPSALSTSFDGSSRPASPTIDEVDAKGASHNSDSDKEGKTPSRPTSSRKGGSKASSGKASPNNSRPVSGKASPKQAGGGGSGTQSRPTSGKGAPKTSRDNTSNSAVYNDDSGAESDHSHSRPASGKSSVSSSRPQSGRPLSAKAINRLTSFVEAEDENASHY